MTGPWARAFLETWDRTPQGSDPVVSEVRVEPSLITARVDGRSVTLSAQPIPAGVWAAIAAQVTPDRQSLELAQLLEHTWEEPLVPEELVVGERGRQAEVAAASSARAAAAGLGAEAIRGKRDPDRRRRTRRGARPRLPSVRGVTPSP